MSDEDTVNVLDPRGVTIVKDWQPIETAPKDGQSVLTWDGKLVDMAHWSTFWGAPGCWVVDNTDRGIGPTHWMPLPEASYPVNQAGPSWSSSVGFGKSALAFANASLRVKHECLPSSLAPH